MSEILNGEASKGYNRTNMIQNDKKNRNIFTDKEVS